MNDIDGLHRLGLDSTAALADIRRAYARALRLIDLAEDPVAFQQLRDAYEAATAWAAHKDRAPGLPVLLPGGTAARNALQHEDKLSEGALLAQAASLRFSAGCATLARSDQRLHEEEWVSLLREALAHPDLVNFEARELFEASIATLLAAGWKPGHERLLGAAGQVFGWIDDPALLEDFDDAGLVLWNAYREHFHFMYQRAPERGAQEKVIERLRRSAAPDSAQLHRAMFSFEQMLARFPNWTALTIDPAKIAQWRALYRAQTGAPFPVQAHDFFSTPPASARHDSSRATEIGQFAWGLVGAAYLLYQVCTYLF